MSAVQLEEGIIRDDTIRSVSVGGTPADALVSSVRPDVKHWQHAIDEMLRWKSCPGQFGVDDQPEEAVLDTAIDYAVDQIEDAQGYPAPSSIIPSGSGRIAMEWNDGSFTVIIEFVALGRAIYTRFNHGKVEERRELNRNPKSRKLEMRG